MDAENNTRRRQLLAALSLAPLALATRYAAAAPEWPTRAIKLVLPSGAGGGSDLLGRQFADFLSKDLGQPCVVDNKAGANGILAQEAVIHQPPDGYNLLVSYQAAMTGNLLLTPKLGRNGTTDLTPIGRMAGGGGNMLIVDPKLPIQNIKQLVEYGKANTLNYASWGKGSGGHLLMEMLKVRTGLQATHIPYKTVSQIPSAVMAGEVPIAWVDSAWPLGLIQSKRLRAIAVSSGARMPQLPDVQTLGEQGVPFKQDAWYGLFGPAGMPAELVNRINTLLNAWLALPATQDFFITRQNWPGPQPTTPAEFKALLQADMAVWKSLMADAKVEPEL
jgi:tripartite-type tricarboxylate transporter receptor subunit TctC